MTTYSSSKMDNFKVSPRKVNRNAQTCALCANHDVTSLKKGHSCDFKDCVCILCQLLKRARKIIQLQLAFWRYVTSMAKEEQQCVIRKNKQLCDNCRNHMVFIEKRGHKDDCQYKDCSCPYCLLTLHRRKMMMTIQKVRRGRVTIKPKFRNSEEGDEENNNQVDSDDDDDEADVEMLSELTDQNEPPDECSYQESEDVSVCDGNSYQHRHMEDNSASLKTQTTQFPSESNHEICSSHGCQTAIDKPYFMQLKSDSYISQHHTQDKDMNSTRHDNDNIDMWYPNNRPILRNGILRQIHPNGSHEHAHYTGDRTQNQTFVQPSFSLVAEDSSVSHPMIKKQYSVKYLIGNSPMKRKHSEEDLRQPSLSPNSSSLPFDHMGPETHPMGPSSLSPQEPNSNPLHSGQSLDAPAPYIFKPRNSVEFGTTYEPFNLQENREFLTMEFHHKIHLYYQQLHRLNFRDVRKSREPFGPQIPKLPTVPALPYNHASLPHLYPELYLWPAGASPLQRYYGK